MIYVKEESTFFKMEKVNLQKKVAGDRAIVVLITGTDFLYNGVVNQFCKVHKIWVPCGESRQSWIEELSKIPDCGKL